MKAEKILILILLIFLTVSTVSAAEDNTTSDDLATFQEYSIEDEPLESDPDDSLQRSDDASLSAGKGNFNDLNNIITNAEENSEIRLTNDYTYDKKTDSNYDDGIKIGETLTINGQYHTINGKDKTVFEIKGKNVIIKNIIFKDTRIYINGEDCTIVNCNFVNCTSEEEPTIYSSRNDFNLINCTFLECNAGYGWNDVGVVISSGANCTIVNCRFNDCSAECTRSIVYSSGTNCTIVNCSFLDCFCGFEGYGGAIYSHGDKFRLINSSFIGCFADHTGGALYSIGIDCSVFNCSFENCFSRCYLPESESSMSRGGAIYAENNFNALNCSFINCTANKGGAIGSDDPVNGSIINCIFIDCSATYGGAIHSQGGETGYDNYIIVNCCFQNCSAYYGGVISSQKDYYYGEYLAVVNHNIVNCSFLDCFADDYGGAIYSCDNDLQMNDCSFINCTADKGGAIYNSGDKCQIENSSFTGCHAEYGSFTDIGHVGGAIYSNANCEIVNSTFTDCTIKSRITASDLKMYYDDRSYYTVRIYGDDSNAASGASVTFRLDGKTIGKAKTDSNGYAKVKITSPPKTYKIKVTALGASKTKKIKIKHVLSLETVNIKKSAKKLTLKATLKNKNPLKGKTVKFKFNNKKYTAKTNKKGIAKVTIKKSALKNLKAGQKVKYSTTYKKDTVKRTAKVEK